MRRELERPRAEILNSWQRLGSLGLSRNASVETDVSEHFNTESALLRAAGPVVNGLAKDLAGTECAILLADKERRIVMRRTPTVGVERALDQVLAVPGANYAEELSGTNALATVYETGEGIFVFGEEHYLAELHGFSCYGHPILHPVTGALVGVLDLTGLSKDASAFMRALVVAAVREIQRRLLETSPSGEIRLLSQYKLRAARSTGAVLGFSDNLTLLNDTAMHRLDDEAMTELRELCFEIRPGQQCVIPLRVRSLGLVDQARVSGVEGAGGAHLIEVCKASGKKTSTPTPATNNYREAVAKATRGTVNVMISGESGSGRSSVARSIAHDDSAVYIGLGTEPSRAVRLLREAKSTVVVDDLETIPTQVLDELVNRVGSVRMIFTVVSGSSPEQRRFRYFDRVTLPPLRDRKDEFASIARGFAKELGGIVLTGEALSTLSKYGWPGNLTELRSVLVDLAEHHDCDRAVFQEDLPAHILWAPSRSLTPLEHAEYRELLSSLGRYRGNKVRVSQDLGIGRNTLYRRLRRYGISI